VASIPDSCPLAVLISSSSKSFASMQFRSPPMWVSSSLHLAGHRGLAQIRATVNSQPFARQRRSMLVAERGFDAVQLSPDVSTSQPDLAGHRSPEQRHAGVDNQADTVERRSMLVAKDGLTHFRVPRWASRKTHTAFAPERSGEVQGVNHSQLTGGQPRPQIPASQVDVGRLRLRQIKPAQVAVVQLQRTAQPKPAQVQPTDDLRPRSRTAITVAASSGPWPVRSWNSTWARICRSGPHSHPWTGSSSRGSRDRRSRRPPWAAPDTQLLLLRPHVRSLQQPPLPHRHRKLVRNDTALCLVNTRPGGYQG
jgi:hypothetical protein